eukprot:gnl/MRDRNA2_/MRDRNA2_85210_c0_seq2.p1 gnl/MRDRNA2_/MRDRNA2_85210_c0~~gnl/MRDRNA2_/MRDRNA2_85210_c0_seq2.p1  ORF type:complete len:181 (+),score=32.94 gnl/MRDRNA2_/MRDRNA2_85210_c0_seq2:68-610(+)
MGSMDKKEKEENDCGASTSVEPFQRCKRWQKHDIVSSAHTSASRCSSSHPVHPHPSMNHSKEHTGNIPCDREFPDDVDLGLDENHAQKVSSSSQTVMPGTPNTDLSEAMIFKESSRRELCHPIDPAARTQTILDLKPYIEHALKMKEEGVDFSDSSCCESRIASEETLRDQNYNDHVQRL